MKDFDSWNELKKKIESKEKSPFANKRDIWWCHFGLNIGSEEDGKNELYERPVIVIKVLNTSLLRVAPLTSNVKDDKHHFVISYNQRQGSVILSQTKTMSTKRLSRKIAKLDKEQFDMLMVKIKDSL